jgi:hypothetical protein
VAAERDRRGRERATADEHRKAAADERTDEHGRWADRAPVSAGGAPPGGSQEQEAIDVEAEASYRGWLEDDRARAAADRTADAADRLAAEQDRIAAQRDREAARVDREQDSRDRAAATSARDHPRGAELSGL